jgi:predicted DsbA family dithiol-disulfide isomerase
MNDKTKLTVDVVSDVACPWCFIGMKRLEHAIAMAPEVEVAVRWRPYQLDPTIPPDGLPRKAYMLQKFGSEQKLREIHDRIVPLGEAEGIRFNFEGMQVSANTLDAHRLIRWAGSQGTERQTAMVSALFKAFWEDGRNIGDDAVLVALATEAGLDPEIVGPLLAGDADRAEVRHDVETAQRMGITGVPCFILDGKYAVMGAQDVDALMDAIRNVAANSTA